MDTDEIIAEITAELRSVSDEINSLERRIDTLDRTFVKCTSDILEALKIQADMTAEMGEIISLAKSPSEEDLEKYAAIREAFDRYDFVRKLAIGKE